MKIENFIVLCLIFYFALTCETINSLRISNLNSNNQFIEKQNNNFSQKSDPINSINNQNNNINLNIENISDKVQPPTFSKSFIEKGNLQILNLNIIFEFRNIIYLSKEVFSILQIHF